VLNPASHFIADRFARSGIAALTYDKRGSGSSTGDWKSSSYDDLANDALAAIDLLASKPDMDPKRIGLHGHSEGGIIAPIATAHAPGKVAFVIAEDTVAGLVRNQDVFRVSHAIREAGLTDGEIKRAMAISGKALTLISTWLRDCPEFQKLQAYRTSGQIAGFVLTRMHHLSENHKDFPTQCASAKSFAFFFSFHSP
jgi:predicted alpha/beta hydrolase